LKIVTVEELITQKILAFDLYNENRDKIMCAGEFLTPGKLLQLHHISTLYRKQDPDISQENSENKTENNNSSTINEKNIKKIETVNIAPKSQRDIKTLFSDALNEAVKKESKKTTNLCLEARDRIVEQVLPMVDDLVYKSQLQIQGDYNYSHGINVSMMSTALANRLGYDETMVRDIALGAMLHDIGKSRIPQEIFEKKLPTNKETKIIQMHTIVGYKILKEEMGLAEHIAKIALEHHEKNDGSGYPYGISGELISPATQIVMVCDMYDNLTAKKSQIVVKNPKEAVKVLMEIGSKWFSPDVLYSFVYMSNYNDLTPI
jgi:putative nucleotidyltransferase with HDIG domain